MNKTETETDFLESLEIPKTNIRALMGHFGPGLVLMMTGIGTSHLITAPVAGGRHEFALLWCIPIAYIFKYYGFEMAFRFTHATGRSMLDAYGTAWKKWPLWYVLITTILQCAVGQAGRLVAASAVLYYFFSEYLGINIVIGGADVAMPIYALVIAILSIFIILGGKYAAIELFTKISAGLLCVSAVAVFVAKPVPLSSMGHFFIFEMPEGSWLIIAGFLGLLPTGMDVSLQASEWGKAKKAGMAKIRDHLEETGLTNTFDPLSSKKEDLTVDITRLPAHAQEYCRKWFKIGIWDFRHGHIISFLIACIFLLLAAVWLYESPVDKKTVVGEIAKIFTSSIGPGMMIVFLLGSFAATFSTAFNYFDGWPRVVGACCRNMFASTSRLRGLAKEDLTREHRRTWHSEYNIYRMTMLYSLVASVIIIAFDFSPVTLVLVASALAYFIAPIIFFLNLYYCHTVIPKHDKVFYPSTFATWFSWGSLVIFTGMSVILILARIFEIEFFAGAG